MSQEFNGVIAIQKNSFIDYPGTVSTVLFFGGCNLRCPYCHNPDIVQNLLPQIDFRDIRYLLLKRKNCIDGVVLSGGEPTLHASLPKIVQELRSDGFLIKIDTNGLNPEVIQQCKPDYLAMDLKSSPDRYPDLGYRGDAVEKRLVKTIDIVKNMKHSAEIRITAASCFVNEETIYCMADLLEGIEKVFIQPVKLLAAPLEADFFQSEIQTDILEEYCSIIKRKAVSCSIRGK